MYYSTRVLREHPSHRNGIEKLIKARVSEKNPTKKFEITPESCPMEPFGYFCKIFGKFFKCDSFEDIF